MPDGMCWIWLGWTQIAITLKNRRGTIGGANGEGVWDISNPEEEEERWLRRGLLDKNPARCGVSERGDDGPDIAQASKWQERGRPRVRRQIQPGGRSDHTADTLLTLTDTSAAPDLEDMERSGFLSYTARLLSTRPLARKAKKLLQWMEEHASRKERHTN